MPPGSAPELSPPRFNVLGVEVSAVDPRSVLRCISEWIAHGEHQYVCFCTVHGVMEAQRDLTLRQAYNRAGLTVPDGMPLVWMGRFAGHKAVARVYGPDLMLSLCEEASHQGWSCFFYGGAPGVAEGLTQRLEQRFPALKVVGAAAPPFRPLTPEEEQQELKRISRARPDIVWVGLGCPKQERWMARQRDFLDAAVLLGVGAAFDFHVGRVRQAPRWMQSAGLEWFFRLLQEPRRLWYRYLVYNPLFILHVAAQYLGLRRAHGRAKRDESDASRG